ncbi:MAG: bifunctional phosphoglucose/phosphomannose isomerase [Chloroflexi bacterium]|nr:bifunctional phosphoglucose/phosphomannose isomerase [Chloroflexota bacterium]
MIDLDNWTRFRETDSDDMLGRIAELPQQCHDAWRNVQGFELPHEYRQVSKIVILGLGGSAIGGDLLRALAEPECALPMVINRDYNVPAFVNAETLVIASSYSGNTEETLAAFEEARGKGAALLAITTDGQLAQRAREWGAPLLTFSYKSQPRAALGYSLVSLIGIVQKLGLIADKSADLAEAAVVMEAWQGEIRETVPSAQNPAKQLARRLYGHLPVVYGAGYLAEVARRWKTQFNENAKAWSFFEQLPELNHNAVLGYQFPPDLAEKVVVVMLTSSLDHPRNKVRFQVTQEILTRQGVACETVEARGQSSLAQILSAIHFGDYVSYYLAMLYQVDPSPVPVINYLKERLAQL